MKVNSKYNSIFFIGLFLLISLIIWVVSSAKTNYYIFVIDAQITNKNDNSYPNCYLKWNNNKYLITNYYKYKNDVLIEYKTPTSLGFKTVNLTDSSAVYTGSRDRYKKLWHKKKSDGLQLDKEKFKIDYLKKDTIVSKINDTVIKVIVLKFVDKNEEL